jgi:hypothetical protein
MERLRAAPTLNDQARLKAIQPADQLVDDAGGLNKASRTTTSAQGCFERRIPTRPPWPEAARRLKPNNPAYVKTLSFAEFRLRRYADVLNTLNQAPARQSEPTDFAVLALTRHALGNDVQARALLRQLTDIMKKERWKNDQEAWSLFNQALHRLSQKP